MRKYGCIQFGDIPVKISETAVASLLAPRSEKICIPTQIPKIGLPVTTAASMISRPPIDSNWAIHAPNAPTPGTTNASALKKSSA